MTDSPYAAHDRLIAPLRPRAQIWRLLAGLVLIAVVIFGLNSLLHAAVRDLAPPEWYGDLFHGRLPGPTLILLASFGFMTIASMAAANLLQNRPPLSLLGPPGLALVQFWRVLRLLLLLGVVILLLPPYDMGDAALIPNLTFGHWAMLLPLSLLAVLIQTSAEEILFRGFLQQSLAARFRHPAIWLMGPALLFALGHFTPEEAGANAGLIVIWAAVFGLLMGDLTARAGSLGPAIAVHFFNNITALLITASPETLNGLSLYILPFPMGDTGIARGWLAVDFALIVISWLLGRIAIRR
ncbi:CPBP family intramembrane glutamic endopeptidase [Pseudodonghicola flavimaris]|uniref:CPBP family intramembrane metalloprotease n=1 Tax=Pseudodonghicola flavimaris TaxID=3050036 RepID=A0ABT7EZ83_9RHOB|nr:CPBP family intramembrane glutamic endopeptidase [Pseudodonghicola flavimaris]MDK3017657.1 CPBP family intramembrane metalloprotease [Pseudodonghicola flavimaris]